MRKTKRNETNGMRETDEAQDEREGTARCVIIFRYDSMMELRGGRAFVLLLAGGRGRDGLSLVQEEAMALPSVRMASPRPLDLFEQLRVVLSERTSIGLVPVFFVLLEPGMLCEVSE